MGADSARPHLASVLALILLLPLPGAVLHPDCSRPDFQFHPHLENEDTTATSAEECQALCAKTEECAGFSFWNATGACLLAGAGAQLVKSAGALAGYGHCAAALLSSPLCKSEVPGNGWPGSTGEASNAAWPSGRQPSSLECWPRSWDGGYVPCARVSVVEDAKQDWPGKCHGLTRQIDVQSSCAVDCIQNPLCASWQTVGNATAGGCWQGVGRDCFVRQNFAPTAAQRLQHGDVRVLMNLTGWHIIGLARVFENSAGFFLHEADAVAACRTMCYSDITCQYWTYAPKFGCWMEDASEDFRPAYPLTLDFAYRSTEFALDVVAGEYIQHYCPQDETTAFPTASPRPTRCMEAGVRYDPLDMLGQIRSVEPSLEACVDRCRSVEHCAHFAYYPDGGCHLQDAVATQSPAMDAAVISGPPACTAAETKMAAAASNATASREGWFTDEAEEALQAPAPPSAGAGAAGPAQAQTGQRTAAHWGTLATAASPQAPLAAAPGDAGAAMDEALNGQALPEGARGEEAADCTGLCQWWPFLVGAPLTLVAVGSVAACLVGCRGNRKGRSLEAFDDDASEGSDDNASEDERIWAEEPSWSAGRAAPGAATAEQVPLIRNGRRPPVKDFTV